MSPLHSYIERVQEAFKTGKLVRLTLSGNRGESDVKKIRAQPTMIRGEKHLSFTFSYRTKDTHRNLREGEIGGLLHELLASGFSTSRLVTTAGDSLYERGVDGREGLKEYPPTETALPDLSHDRRKRYLVDAAAKYLHLLGITDSHGKVRRDRNDKFRQVCKFIEVVAALLDDLPPGKKIRSVLDIGSGKSYLTFALYDYLVSRFGAVVFVRGIEIRNDLVESSNIIAQECGFTGLSFLHSTGEAAIAPSVDMVVALHACDTATDEAILQGLNAEAALVIVAPCCHKYVRRSLVMPKTLKPVLGHGILEARLADSLTDGLRALFLKAHGYSVKVFEFISSEHTAKNTMITAVRNGAARSVDLGSLAEIAQIKAEFSLPDFYLDKRAQSGA